jgi:hypothetical protein
MFLLKELETVEKCNIVTVLCGSPLFPGLQSFFSSVTSHVSALDRGLSRELVLPATTWTDLGFQTTVCSVGPSVIPSKIFFEHFVIVKNIS